MAEESGSEKIAEEQIKISIYTPLIYVAIILGIFITFSIIYRRNRLKKLANIEPIFPENQTAKLYESLKQVASDPNVPKDQKPHDKVLKAALLRRAAEAIRRSMKLKENEPTFNKLYEDGLIGDDIYKQFEVQAKFQELELKEIVAECETFKKGWVQTFFPVAQEICFNEALRRRLNSMDERSKEFAQLWEYYVDQTEKNVPAEKTAKKIKPAKTEEKVEAKVEPKVEPKVEVKAETKEVVKEEAEEEEDDEEGETDDVEDEDKDNESSNANNTTKSKKKKGGKGKKK